jgi:Tfp pilus assembly protein PilE
MPSYQSSVQTTHRSDALDSLMALALAQEQFFTPHETYTVDLPSSAGLNAGSAASALGLDTVVVVFANSSSCCIYHNTC